MIIVWTDLLAVARAPRLALCKQLRSRTSGKIRYYKFSQNPSAVPFQRVASMQTAEQIWSAGDETLDTSYITLHTDPRLSSTRALYPKTLHVMHT